MGKTFEEIPEHIFPWIQRQKMFFVATAPLTQSGHVNVSPKGFEGTFHVVSNKKVWYEDMTGSGIETISHIRENSRITIMFCAFQGAPQILRLFGTGAIHEFDTPEYNALMPVEKRQPGSRSIIMVDVHRVGTSCGFSVPIYTFKTHRMVLHTMAAKKETCDINAESRADENDDAQSPPALPEDGLKSYWERKNQKSIDGLSGLQTAFTSKKAFDTKVISKILDRERFVEVEEAQVKVKSKPSASWSDAQKIFIGFAFGIFVSLLWRELMEVARHRIKA